MGLPILSIIFFSRATNKVTLTKPLLIPYISFRALGSPNDSFRGPRRTMSPYLS